ncbi:hypothetical protein K488DRAFT_48196 [Vararia minispora EC-137]|uniref:Uncharacterized protein n=1 Tax=Vararia minispora EC-137 TaxID=1314806 RepID=A0ACB8QMW7_9AGAM|nr:hypothetical protein K488DRAFT_48196 [Vararia minispora EC-137]
MSDPVKDKSGFLCMYMSGHPDTLVSYAKHFGKLKARDVVSAKMVSIDSKGMDLTYVTKSNPNPQPIRVTFDPPLAGYDEVKPRLLAMKADADESLGEGKIPQITTFELPSAVLSTGIALMVLIYCTYAPLDDPAPVWELARWLRATIAQPLIIKISWGVVFIVHSLEGFYTSRLARKHQMPPAVAASYIGGVTLFGYPLLMHLRRRIQNARIDAIMKGN